MALVLQGTLNNTIPQAQMGSESIACEAKGSQAIVASCLVLLLIVIFT